MTTPSTPSPGAGELLPCPHCGSSAQAVCYVAEAAVRCDNPRCRAGMTKRHLLPTGDDGLATVTEAWNRRTPAAPSAPLAGTFRERAEEIGRETVERMKSARIVDLLAERDAASSRAERAERELAQEREAAAGFEADGAKWHKIACEYVDKLAAAQGEAGRMLDALTDIRVEIDDQVTRPHEEDRSRLVWVRNVARAAIAGEGA